MWNTMQCQRYRNDPDPFVPTNYVSTCSSQAQPSTPGSFALESYLTPARPAMASGRKWVLGEFLEKAALSEVGLPVLPGGSSRKSRAGRGPRSLSPLFLPASFPWRSGVGMHLGMEACRPLCVPGPHPSMSSAVYLNRRDSDHTHVWESFGGAEQTEAMPRQVLFLCCKSSAERTHSAWDRKHLLSSHFNVTPEQTRPPKNPPFVSQPTLLITSL